MTKDQMPETGPWDAALAQIREWDPAWAAACAKMTTNPWSSAVLPRKTVELISLAINAACTNLNPDGTRRHIRAALEAGATRDEVLFVLKAGSLMSIHSCSLGAPILLEEAKAAGEPRRQKPPPLPQPATRCARLDNGIPHGIHSSILTRPGPISSLQPLSRFIRAV